MDAPTSREAAAFHAPPMSKHADPAFALSDRFVDDLAARCPTLATLAGIPGHHDRWEDLSPAGCDARRAFFAAARSDVARLPAASDAVGRLARRVLAEYLDERIEYFDTGDHLADLNNIESPFQHLRMALDLMDTSSDEGLAALVTRIATIGEPLEGLRASLELGASRGAVVARRQVAAVIDQARSLAAENGSLGLLLPASASSTTRVAFDAAVASARRAYATFADWLERDYATKATSRDGMGKDRYARAAWRFNGLDLDLLETYAWGAAEVERIEAQMRALANEIVPGASVAEVIAHLEKDPAQRIEDAATFLRLVHERQARALADLEGRHFAVPAPIRDIAVKLAPPGGALGAYYVPPDETFTRPGTIFYSPGESPDFRLFREVSTAYHEGFPGHHLQCGLQVHMAERLTRAHRLLVVCSGYAEGWALYAEELMHELGYLDRPEYVLGMAMAKLFRACRVVVDIGLHLELEVPERLGLPAGKRWDFDLAVAFMRDRGLIGDAFARSEVTRYLGWPGQAISYKVGERVILELRREVEAKQRDAFDLRTFHEVILGTGSVGLGHLQDVVREAFPAS